LFWRQLLLVEKPVMRRILAVSVMLLVGAIVLSRSRGAWLVSAGLAISLPTATWLFFNGRSTGGTRDAVRLWTAAIVIGVAAAVFVPNRLGWGFADFASSAERLLDLEDGTGRGRLIQSVTTLRMIEEEPLLGVGPGNWGILYPAFARSGDPSLTPESIYPAPHQPRGDLLSLTAEFGLPGLILMMAATWGVICRALVMRRDQRPQVRYSGLMVIGLVASTIILGMSDPIVRLSPTLVLVSVLVGLGLAHADIADVETPLRNSSRHVVKHVILAGCVVASLVAALGAGRDAAAIRALTSMDALEDIYKAVRIAPNNVEAQVVLSYVLVSINRCEQAMPHLMHAAKLQPYSGAIARLRSRCSQNPVSVQ